MSRSKKSFPVTVVKFLLVVVFVGAVLQNLFSALGVLGVILLVVAGVVLMRGVRSVRRRFKQGRGHS
ncbi:MAG: hypothetical protein H9W81_07555 [Enterococcus sp.]|nr:hypothetical protein [Enterococcus sp.]